MRRAKLITAHRCRSAKWRRCRCAEQQSSAVIPLVFWGHRRERRMMGRRENGQGQFFYSFDLDEVVPPDHLVRQIDDLLDLSWVHKELAPVSPASL
jgi:hypothetical protein